MKKIQVKISAKEWAEKRMQLVISTIIAQMSLDVEQADSIISSSGFILDEGTPLPPIPTE